MSEVAIIEGETREIAIAEERGVMVTPFVPSDLWSPIAIPSDWTMQVPVPGGKRGEFEVVKYEVDWSALSKATPRGQRKLHPKGFYYVTVDYCKQRLNEAFGNGRWVFRVTGHAMGRTYTMEVGKDRKKKTYIETIVEGFLSAPGLAGPVYGVGSAPWAQDDQGDPRYSLATARNSAESNALKNAARKLGIGSDIKEDEEGSKELIAARKSAATMFASLIKANKKDAAVAVFEKHAPLALNAEKTEVAEDAISEDDIDDLVAELSKAFLSK